MEPAQQAYKDWKSTQRLSMQVYTDEQMFIIGYNMASQYAKEVSEIALEIDKENEKLKKQLKAKTK